VIRRLFLFIFLFCGIHTGLFAQDYRFEATVESTQAQVGVPFLLTLTFYGAQDLAAIQLPVLDGFTASYYGPSTRMSIINGKSSLSISHNYSLIPLKEGTFELPALHAAYKGQEYTTLPISIAVSGAVASNDPAVPAVSAGDLKDRLFVFLDSDKKTVYCGESFNLSVKLYIANLRVSDIQMPDIQADAFTLGDFSTPRQYTSLSNGVNYNVVEFNLPMTANRAGEQAIGADIGLNLVAENKQRSRGMLDDDFGSFFGSILGGYRSYPMKVSANKVNFTVKVLPETGRPADFNGLVGDYTLKVEASPREVKLGDPITLKIFVTGNGDFKGMLAPEGDFKDDFKLYDAQAKLVSGGKEFERAVVPLKDTIKQIPSLSLSFFDTTKGLYRTIVSEPIEIKVAPLPAEQKVVKVFEKSNLPLLGQEKPQIIGQDIVFIKNQPGSINRLSRYWYMEIGFYLVILFFAAVCLAATAAARHCARMQNDTHYARCLLAPRTARMGIKELERLMHAGNVAVFYDRMFKLLQDYLGGRFHAASAGITAGFVEDILKTKKVDDNILAMVKNLFNECDIARFAAGNFSPEAMSISLENLRIIVDRLERVKL